MSTPNPLTPLMALAREWEAYGALPSQAHWNDSKLQAAIELRVALKAWAGQLPRSSNDWPAFIRERVLGVEER